MKLSRAFAFALLLIVLPVATFAEENSQTVNFDKTVKVGDTELKPGAYRVTWNGHGPDVQVTFSQNNETVASTTAKLVNSPAPVGESITTRMQSDSTSTLEELEFKNLALHFDRSDIPSRNSRN